MITGLIVDFSFLWISQNIIGLFEFVEFLFGVGIFFVLVGMILEGEFSVLFFLKVRQNIQSVIELRYVQAKGEGKGRIFPIFKKLNECFPKVVIIWEVLKVEFHDASLSGISSSCK